MKQFIRYLYEYDRGRRTRNVGFVKVEQDEGGCTLHIHGKGLRLGNESSLEIFLFFEQEGKCRGIRLGEAGNIAPALNCRLRYTKADTGGEENYARTAGILLKGAGGRRFVAFWTEEDVDIEEMQMWDPESAKMRIEDKEDGGVQNGEGDKGVTRQAREESADGGMKEGAEESEDGDIRARMEDAADGVMRERMEDAADGGMHGRMEETADGDIQESIKGFVDSRVREQTEARAEIIGQESTEPVYAEAEVPKGAIDMSGPVVDGQSGIRREHARKLTRIQRRELSILPRCEWHLANNNFLLHGYYNYRHLVLIDDGTVLKLGVPGIYHAKEAEAAAGFGFPEFIGEEDAPLHLKDGERHRGQQFGYWCRQVRRPVR